MILVTGGSASGKSAFAERLVVGLGKKQRIYIATMIPWDEECRERIQRHRILRKDKEFETLECPVDLHLAPVREGGAVLLECMHNLAAIEFYRIGKPGDLETVRKHIRQGVRHLMDRSEDLVVVTNEVFGDGGPYSEETREYQRLLGAVNQDLGRMAGQAYEVVCGIPLALK